MLLIEKMSEIRYPIYYCRVRGRISTPTNPRKGQRTIPKPKIKEFKIEIPVKFYPFDRDTEKPVPVNTRSTSIQSKYGTTNKDTIYYDKIELLAPVGDTRIKD